MLMIAMVTILCGAGSTKIITRYSRSVLPSKKGEKVSKYVLVNPKVIIYGIFSDVQLIPTLTSLTLWYSFILMVILTQIELIIKVINLEYP